MAGRGQLTNVDPETAAEMRRKGWDPYELDQFAETALAHIYFNLPSFPFYEGARLPPALATSDGVDRISSLPRELRRDIVARLPVKEAARTAVLSSRWRTIWLCTPLILIDVHLLPKVQGFCPTLADTPAITAAVSSIFESHPGPFACVHLVCSRMEKYRAQLARWLQLLAAKGVQDLVVVNRPWPREVPLPATIFTITTLTRLYIGLWKLPDTAALQGTSFPHLGKLGLCCVQMEHGVVDALVARSPVLEILNIMGCYKGLRLRLVSQSLRCVQICRSAMENVAVVKAPRLERFLLYAPLPKTGSLCTRVRIGDAPKLHAFGYLQPGQVLEIRDTIIMPGITATTGSMLTSVKVLSLNVRFGVRNDAKMVPTFLRCFPNIERLHIMSEKCDKPTGDLTAKFWEESCPIENVASRIKLMSLHEFKGAPSKVGFLEYFLQNARALKTAMVALANPSFTQFSKDAALTELRKCFKRRVSDSCTTVILGSTGPEGGEYCRFQKGADFSFHDPFSVAEVVPA